jgi:metal-dependent amidase/aminoacylase/carboxypeptidase family protein
MDYMSQTGAKFEPIEEQQKASRGSTDMGNVTQLVDGIHPVFDIGCHEAYHTVEFGTAAGGMEAHKRAMNAARALCLTALDAVSLHSVSVSE